MITKSDFLVYVDSPIHFWALKHGKAQIPSPSLFDQHLFEQGKIAETFAKEYVYSVKLKEYSNAEILWQHTFFTDHLEARADAIIHDLDSNEYDIFEIKGSSQIKPEHKYDIAFQSVVCSSELDIRDCFIVYIDKDYTREGEVEIPRLFKVVNANQFVEELLPVVSEMILDANRIEAKENYGNLEPCLNPKECICLDLCHPKLTQDSIFNINGIRKNKKQELREMGVDRIQDVPEGYKLPLGQERQVQATKKDQLLIFKDELTDDLNRLVYPLHFLDYEAFNPSIPYYDGYKPFQYIPFQYSLHVLQDPCGDLIHHAFIDFDQGDPGFRLIQDLQGKIGPKGSIIVWSRSFEMSRHKEMAERYPGFSDLLLTFNERIYDLMVPFQKGMYVDPKVKGKYSIKDILPAINPEYSYDDLTISSGTEAMLEWEKIYRERPTSNQVGRIKTDLLDYCKLDTLAMVKILQFLFEIVR